MSVSQLDLDHLEKLKQDMQEAKNDMGITHDGWFYWSLKKEHDDYKDRLTERINRE